jgi:hypothetical protein
MADGWQVGDLALCIWRDNNFGWEHLCGPRSGAISTVSQVKISPQDGDIYLCFQDWPSHMAFHHAEFRKIRPLSDEERDSFLADLGETQPVTAPEPA